MIASLPRALKIVDLSADFRLADLDSYATWYGHAHRAPALQEEAVYGLTELARAAVTRARLVANPGCYPTSAQLPLIPLLEAGGIAGDDIIIDAKSGVTGAGRDAKQQNLFSEVTEGVHAYGIAGHRHAPEIEQGLSEAAGRPVIVNFTPHLMPMSRGILSSIYVRLADGASAGDLKETLARKYAGEPFVRVLANGQSPATRHVRGSNHCLIGVYADRVPGRAILVSVDRQSGEGRLRPGGAEHEPDDRLGRDDRPRAAADVPLSRSAHMQPLIIPFEGRHPKIAPDAFIAPTAVIIGDVEIGPRASVWYGCVLRGDTNSIRIGAETNLQDGTVIHVNHSPEGMERGAAWLCHHHRGPHHGRPYGAAACLHPGG